MEDNEGPGIVGLTSPTCVRAAGAMAPLTAYALYLITSLAAKVMRAIFAIARNTER